MSQAPTPQRDKTSPPLPEPAGGSAPPPAAGPVPARTAGWAATAAAWIPPAVAAAAMLVLGWWGIARDNSMGNDEVATRWAALLPLRELAHLLGNVDAVHGLYYLLMHGWVALGSSPVVLRIPSVIAMAVAAALMVIIGRRLTGSGWAGLFAGLIMVLTPSISFYAQTARSYAMVFACVLGSTLALLHAMEAEAAGRPSRRWWLVYAGLITLGGYLNEMSLLVLAAHAVTVLLARYGQPAVERWLWAAGGGAALVVPLVLLSIEEQAALGWVTPPGLTDLRVLVQDYFGVETVAAGLVVICAVVALLPPRGTWRWLPARAGQAGAAQAGAEPEPAWWRSGGVSPPSVAAPLLVLPAAILMTESILLHPVYVDRYVLYGEAGAALLAGVGLYRIGRWLGDVSGRRVLVWLPGVDRVPLRADTAARAAVSRPQAGGAGGTSSAGRPRAMWERTRGRATGSSSSGGSTGRPSWVIRATSGTPATSRRPPRRCRSATSRAVTSRSASRCRLCSATGGSGCSAPSRRCAGRRRSCGRRAWCCCAATS